MIVKALGVLALAAVATLPVAALADDPRDPAMRNAAARAHDRELTRRLNLEEIERVRQREAQGVGQWHVPQADADLYAARLQDYERRAANYRRARAQYDRDMAVWRDAAD